jgi:hypothetical protein
MFDKKGNIFYPITPVKSDTLRDHLPAAIYTIAVTEDGIGLKHFRGRFKTPGKIYGSHAARKKQVLETYDSRNGSTGVILTGAKGTGKSLLTEDIANAMIDRGVPVIYIEDGFPPTAIRHIVRTAGPCMVVFEEFGKIYPIPADPRERNGQSDLLSLFSDSSLNKVLFIVTENAKETISPLYFSRPDRFLFWFRYEPPKMEVLKSVLGDDFVMQAALEAYLSCYLRSAANDSVGGVGGYGSAYGIDTINTIAALVRRYPTLDEFVRGAYNYNIPLLVTTVINVEQSGEKSMEWRIDPSFELDFETTFKEGVAFMALKNTTTGEEVQLELFTLLTNQSKKGRLENYELAKKYGVRLMMSVVKSVRFGTFDGGESLPDNYVSLRFRTEEASEEEVGDLQEDGFRQLPPQWADPKVNVPKELDVSNASAGRYPMLPLGAYKFIPDTWPKSGPDSF